MPRGKVGILGVRKDPKNQILFSFDSRRGAEEWPSDDSDDSDYNPGDSISEPEQNPENKKHVKKLKRKMNEEAVPGSSEKVQKKIKRCKDNLSTKLKERGNKNGTKRKSITATEGMDSNPWGCHIPPEILLQIFSYVVSDKGTLPFLPRACKVCHLWNDIACDPSLWTNVDLSFGWVKRDAKKLQWLLHNRLNKVLKLDLSGWEQIVNDGILQTIGTNCPHLEEISLQGCMKITAKGLQELVENCKKLQGLDISESTPISQSTGKRLRSDITASKNLCSLMDQMGNRLKSLNISCHKINGMSNVMKHMTKTCHQLTKLELYHLDRIDKFVIDIDTLQIECPLIRVLNLNSTMFICTDKRSQLPSPGFIHLEELYLSNSSFGSCHGPMDNVLKRFLVTSKNLRLLDLRYYNAVSAPGLSDLCCTDISQLYLTGTPVTEHEDIVTVFSKWSHSLVELEVDRCKRYCSDFSASLSSLCLGQQSSNLETINLGSSTVTMEHLRELLSACKKIKTIDISSCRSLQAGYKRKYSTYTEVQQLRKRLEI